MSKLIVSLLLVLFFLLPSIVMATPEEARALCIEKTVARCVDQCQKTNDINCSSACQEMARNQCRQAGE